MHKTFFFFSHISWYVIYDEISCNISNITDIVHRDIIIIMGQISQDWIVSYPYHPTPTGHTSFKY